MAAEVVREGVVADVRVRTLAGAEVVGRDTDEAADEVAEQTGKDK